MGLCSGFSPTRISPSAVADRAVVDVGHDGEGLGHAHVVEDQGPLAIGHDLADGILDLAEDPLGFLDAGSGRGADVHAELAGVHGGEEVLAEAGKERRRADREAEQDAERGQAVIEGPGEKSRVRLAQPLEAAVEGLVEG